MDAGRLVAGLDEAGLGPILGPLTIGFSALRIPRACGGGEPLWERLGSSVSADPARDGTHLVVADSKVVYTRNPRGRARLERTALAFLRQGELGPEAPLRGADLLRGFDGEVSPTEEVLARHPWYRLLPERLPWWTAEEELEQRRAELATCLESAGVRLLAAGVRVVPAGELNASYEDTRSKGLTLWWKTSELLGWLWRRFPEDDIELVVDRHGGRTHYAGLLTRTFPFAAVETVEEQKARSLYRVREAGGRGRTLELHFRERAEEHSFAVALASCLAKYLREISMQAFNTYFCGLQPDLRPTAGYVTDGRRWLADAREALERADLAPEVLIRNR